MRLGKTNPRNPKTYFPKKCHIEIFCRPSTKYLPYIPFRYLRPLQAIEFTTKRTNLVSFYTVAYLKLGQLLLTMNREEEAKQLLHNCSKLDGNGLKDPKVHEIAKIEAMIKLAAIESKNGYHQNALSIYMQAIVSAPAYYKPQVKWRYCSQIVVEQLLRLPEVHKIVFPLRFATLSTSSLRFGGEC